MSKAVLDTTVLVSALLNLRPGGVSYELLGFAKRSVFELCLSEDSLDEAARTLRRSRLKDRYAYSDADVLMYRQELVSFATIVGDLPEVKVVRDPNDDMIVACALAAGADYIVTRDKDLLSLGTYQEIGIVTPEAFLRVLREHESKSAP